MEREDQLNFEKPNLNFKIALENVLKGRPDGIATLEKILIEANEQVKNQMFHAMDDCSELMKDVLDKLDFSSDEKFRSSRDRLFKSIEETHNPVSQRLIVGCTLWVKSLLLGKEAINLSSLAEEQSEKKEKFLLARKLGVLCNQAADRLNFAPAIIKTNLRLLDHADDFPADRLAVAMSNGSFLAIQLFKEKLLKATGRDLAVLWYVAMRAPNLSQEIKDIIDKRMAEFQELKMQIVRKLFRNKIITRDEIEILYYWILLHKTEVNEDSGIIEIFLELHLLLEDHGDLLRDVINADSLATAKQKQFFWRFLPRDSLKSSQRKATTVKDTDGFELTTRTRNLLAVLNWMETKYDPVLELSKKALQGDLQSVKELELTIAAKDSDGKKQVLEKLNPILEKLVWHTDNELHNSVISLVSTLKEDFKQRAQVPVLGCALWLQGMLFQTQHKEALAKECISLAVTLSFGPAITVAFIKSEMKFTNLLKENVLIHAIQNGSQLAIEIALNKLKSSAEEDRLTTILDCENYANLCEALVKVTSKPVHELINAESHAAVMLSCYRMLAKKEKLLPKTIHNLNKLIDGFSEQYYLKLREYEKLNDAAIETLYYAGVAALQLAKANRESGGLITKLSAIFASKLPRQLNELIVSPYKDRVKIILEQDEFLDGNSKSYCKKEIEEIEALLLKVENLNKYFLPEITK